MSIIAEYLFILLRDESLTFSFFKAMVNKYEMAQLFTNDLPLLKELCYQLDRLLHIQRPDLMAYFRNEGISASFFSSAWFMTLFANILKDNDESEKSIVLEVWDAFLLYRWKAIFKAGIFTLEIIGKRLVEVKLDQTMLVIKELSKPFFLNQPEIALEFRSRFKKIPVTNEKLRLLDKEYRYLTENYCLVQP
eukprot:TRINITY_DN10215_c0_g1_i8.p1 TRINITY_DN10215_c0_g1~~TRINITY_DN10215_c0_g1_i8.p1  ORF type:complete len:192 (+),score=32.11 TRINITY_DN10215_c0_g1_i8:486-1061(+)